MSISIFAALYIHNHNQYNRLILNASLGFMSLCADVWSKGEEQQYGGDVYIYLQCAGWQCSRNRRFDCWWAGFPLPLLRVLLTPPIWTEPVNIALSHQPTCHLHLTQLMHCSIWVLMTVISCYLIYLKFSN